MISWFRGARRRGRPRRVAVILAALAPGAALADGPADGDGASGHAIGSVMVVGQSRLDVPLLTQPVARTPQSVDVITAQVIQLNGLSDLRDVLRLDPA